MNQFTPLYLLLALIALTFVSVIGLVVAVNVITSTGMPSLYDLENPQQKFATQILSSDGKVLDHFYQEKRVPLTYKEIPKDFVNALVATEDRTFWKHWGVHSERVVKSLVKNVLARRTKEGASTITMQLARNLYLTREVNFTRKIREAVTAFQIEQTHTKEEIIELYANAVNFGRGAYGLRVASQQFFDKEPKELTTAECAFLVGMLKKPGYYTQRQHSDEAIERRNLVLLLMQEQGYITSTNYIKSTKEQIAYLQLNVPAEKAAAERKLRNQGIAPHFVETVRQSLSKDPNIKGDYDFYEDGLTIYTTLDSRIQQAVQQVIQSYMPKIQQDFTKSYSWNNNRELLNKLVDKEVEQLPEYKEGNAGKRQLLKAKYKLDNDFIAKVKNTSGTIQLGIVVIDQATGGIVAMIGASPKAMAENPDAKYSLNHAVQIYRQPGSSFKPFVYASALQKGRTPESMIESGPYSYTLSSGEVWSPHGSSKDSIGSMTLTRALIGSVNTVSARLITQVTTPGDVVALAQKAGITSNLLAVPALSLGAGGDVSPLELTAAYSIFGNNGIFVNPYFYDKIEDKFGGIIAQRKPFAAYTDVLEKEIAGQMTYMMQQVVNYGTATRVRSYLKNVDAAGKTGTTNDAADAWFIGYTPQLVCGIWMGFDDKRVNFNCLGAVGYGGRICAPLWGEIMKAIYDIPALPYKQLHFPTVNTDSTQSNKPYQLTNTQMERQQQPSRDRSEDDDVYDKTFLPDGAYRRTEKPMRDVWMG
ncbi:MAG: transglycosylase domain-containing protein [Ignavibacteria bacterium]|jgi:penicillin-binding protein 1A|nr:transglycosylase domain-containing protein [Ignavibacteria bacterium]